jgi:hypothetical protein
VVHEHFHNSKSINKLFDKIKKKSFLRGLVGYLVC